MVWFSVSGGKKHFCKLLTCYTNRLFIILWQHSILQTWFTCFLCFYYFKFILRGFVISLSFAHGSYVLIVAEGVVAEGRVADKTGYPVDSSSLGVRGPYDQSPGANTFTLKDKS